MKTVMKSINGVVVATTLMLGAVSAYGAPPFPLPQGPPVWCYGQDEFGRCMLFLGTEESCMDIEPCNTFASAVPGNDPLRFDVWFCMGQDEFGRCQLFAGSEEACMDLMPCSARIGQVPRIPKFRNGE